MLPYCLDIPIEQLCHLISVKPYCILLYRHINIRYYNTERIQRKLQLMTPVEYHESYYAAA